MASSLVAASVFARTAATDSRGAGGATGPVGAVSTSGAEACAKGADDEGIADEGTGEDGAGDEGTGDDGAGEATTSLSAEPVGGTSFIY